MGNMKLSKRMLCAQQPSRADPVGQKYVFCSSNVRIDLHYEVG